MCTHGLVHPRALFPLCRVPTHIMWYNTPPKHHCVLFTTTSRANGKMIDVERACISIGSRVYRGGVIHAVFSRGSCRIGKIIIRNISCDVSYRLSVRAVSVVCTRQMKMHASLCACVRSAHETGFANVVGIRRVYFGTRTL